MLSGLRHRFLTLLIVAVALGGASAPVAVGAGYIPVGTAGGPSMATAVPLVAELGEAGAAHVKAAAWYRFKRAGSAEALIEVGTSTKSCPARFSIVESRGHTLTEIIASSSERLPFSTPLLARSRGNTYYVRVDVDPFRRRCTKSSYWLELLEPRQPDPCAKVLVATPGCAPPPAPAPVREPAPSSTGVGEEPALGPEKESAPTTEATPVVGEGACHWWLKALRRVTVATEQARARYRAHHESHRTLRAVEARASATRRKERAACGY